MSRILILAGSPRRGGNTELLARAFAETAGQRNETELIFAADCRIYPCTGCNSCYTREGHRCFRDDDMQQIYEKLKQADTLIIASPVYFYGISAQLKALVDRLHTPMRNDFRIRKLGLILAGAADLPDLFDPIILQYRMILRFFRLEDAGMVLVPGVKDKGDILATDGIRQVREMARKL
ncbi:MAG: flavodoxin family protein [Clostridia bacterium]|nr:flavodoxin family protein [Clostridia bacterium]